MRDPPRCQASHGPARPVDAWPVAHARCDQFAARARGRAPRATERGQARELHPAHWASAGFTLPGCPPGTCAATPERPARAARFGHRPRPHARVDRRKRAKVVGDNVDRGVLRRAFEQLASRALGVHDTSPWPDGPTGEVYPRHARRPIARSDMFRAALTDDGCPARLRAITALGPSTDAACFPASEVGPAETSSIARRRAGFQWRRAPHSRRDQPARRVAFRGRPGCAASEPR